MTRTPLEWKEGGEEVRRAVDAWWQDPDAPTLQAREIARSKRRRILHITPTGRPGLIIKGFHEKPGGSAWLSIMKRILGQAPWQREQRGLQSVKAHPPLAPAFLGRARTPQGEILLISEFIEGPGLGEALSGSKADTASMLTACGEVIARLHQSGVAHGDLHPGNLLLAEGGPILIDFQRSSKNRTHSRTDDLARLDFSLALIDIPEPERRALIQSVLPDGPDEARAYRRILRRSRQLAAQHRRIRMRHSLRASPERAAVQLGKGHAGLRRMDFKQEELEALLHAHRQATPDPAASAPPSAKATPVQNGDRTFQIHEERPDSVRNRIKESILGSPARRAWQRAHDPQRPKSGDRVLAFSEHRILGVPISSLWVTETDGSQEPTRPQSSPESGKG